MNDEDALTYLLGTYFHQDHDVIDGDAAQTVTAYMRENPHRVDQLVIELDDLGRSDLSESDLEHLADAAGCQINPTYTGETWRHWFASIEAQARAYAAEHPQPRDPGAEG